MVNKYTGKLIAYSLCEKCCCYGTVHSARECKQYLSVTYFFPYCLNGCLCVILHCPVACKSAYFIEEIVKHLHAVNSMVYFRVELYTIKFSFLIFNSPCRTTFGVCNRNETFRQFRNIVGVAHPGDIFFRKTFKQQTFRVIFGHCFSIFSHFCGWNRSAEGICHKLTTVTDSQNRYSKLEYFLAYVWGIFFINAVRPSCENNSLWFHFLYLFNCSIPVTVNFTVNATFTDSPCYKLVVLSTEIKNYTKLMCHFQTPFS